MFWLILLCFTIVSCEKDNSRLVTLVQGPVKGYREPDYGIYGFYGIPYATVPKGDDRFKVSNHKKNIFLCKVNNS